MHKTVLEPKSYETHWLIILIVFITVATVIGVSLIQVHNNHRKSACHDRGGTLVANVCVDRSVVLK